MACSIASSTSPRARPRDFDRPEGKKVLAGVDPALMRSPGPERAAEMTRQYSGEGEVPRPSNLPFGCRSAPLPRAELRRLQLPITPSELDAAGLDREQGIFPWLTIPHRVSEVGGHAIVHLPGGTSETAQYVGAVLGDAVGRPSIVSAPRHAATDLGGVVVRAAPEQIAQLAAELQTAGLPHAVGTTRGVVQIPHLGATPRRSLVYLSSRRAGADPANEPRRLRLET